MGSGKAEEWRTRKGLRRIELWAQAGYSDTELARLMDISRKTYYQWLKKYAEISDSVERGRTHAVDVIEDELFSRARGQTVTVKKSFKVRRIEYDERGRKCREVEEVIPAEEEVYIPADVRAQTYFLNCRRPEDWSEKRTVALDEKTAEALRQPQLTLTDRKLLLDDLAATMAKGKSDGED